MLLNIFLKMIVSSGLLLGYYWLFLRNGRHHRFNRFYLLGTVVVSALAAVVQLDAPVFDRNLLPVAATELPVVWSDWTEKSSLATSHPATGWSWALWLSIVYSAGLVWFLVRWCRNILEMRQLLKKAAISTENGQRLYLTDSPMAPLVFLNRLCWPKNEDPHAPAAKWVMRHELFHIREKHGWDLFLLEAIRVVAWCNPFIHLVGRELRLVHEFGADAAASENAEVADYAELLLEKQLQRHRMQLAMPFSQPPLKRRILMLLTRSGSQKLLGRWLALPLVSLVFLSMTVRTPYNGPGAAGKLIVVDAGHGGIDAGAISGTMEEKNINLAIAQMIAEQAALRNIRVLLTRSADVLPGGATIGESLRYRSNFANQSGAALLVSIHTDTGPDRHASVTVPGNHVSAAVSQAAEHAAAAVVKTLHTVIPVEQQLHKGRNKIWILDQSTIPAFLVECGSMDNPEDRTKLQDEVQLRKMADALLDGIEQWLSSTGKQ